MHKAFMADLLDSTLVFSQQCSMCVLDKLLHGENGVLFCLLR